MHRTLRPASARSIVFGLLALACSNGGLVTDASGGAPGSGGSGTGGAPVASGGTTATGGSSASGGATGAGGSPAVGGTATGGVASGGSAAGGSASGGAASGGQGSGGVATDVPITIWLAGDSTVANGNTPCPVGWGKHFADEFNELVTVVNSAAGGRSVRTWLYEVTTEMGPDEECTVNEDANGDPILQARWTDMMAGMAEGDYLFVQFGINDGSATCDRHVGLERFKQEYAMMADVARSHGTTPVFLTPVSSIGCNSATAIGTRGAYVTATIEAGDENDVPVIDLHQLSVDLYNELAFCPVPGGDVSASTTGPVGDFFCDDHTHFSDAGSVSIGGLVAEAIGELGLPLAAYLKAD